MTDFPKDVLDIATRAFAKHFLRYPHVFPSYRHCMSAALSALEEAGYGVFRAGYVRALEAERDEARAVLAELRAALLRAPFAGPPMPPPDAGAHSQESWRFWIYHAARVRDEASALAEKIANELGSHEVERKP